MKRYNLKTPEGTRDLLYDECTVRRDIEAKLMRLFRDNGYSEVVTPAVEFYDVFAEHFAAECVYKTTDSKGRQLVFRPDSTLPIMRLAETRLRDEPRPLRLCYNQNIYRNNPKEQGRDDEIAQCGVELIGSDCYSEVVELAKRALACISDDYLFEQSDSHDKYYSGPVFSGYISGYGKPVLTGGKYQVGDSSAVGFAVNVSALAEVCSRVANNANRDVIRIALTKGRVEKESVKLFGKMGWDMSAYADRGRKLTFAVPDTNVEIVIAKSADVITYVGMGACDIGITGKDMLDEYGGNFAELLDLGIGKCKFSLIVPAGCDFYAGHAIKKVASKYTAVTRRYFESKGMDVDIVKIEGSVEISPLLGVVDGIVDIVETGATLRENGLEVIEDISGISARVIVNPVAAKLRGGDIMDIVRLIEGVL